MNYESVPPPSLSRVDSAAALVLRVSAVFGVASVTALGCSFPAALRVAEVLPGSATLIRSWAALGSAALAPMAASVIVLRGARQGLRVFAGPGATVRLFGAGLWFTALLVTLSIAGAALRATTHLRPLAAVTFAASALVVAIVYGLASLRVVAIVRGASERARRITMWILGGGAAVSLLWLALRFLRATSDPTSAAAAATVVDVIAYTFFALGGAYGSAFARRSLALVGPPVAVFLAALGLTILHDPPVRQAIGAYAPAFLPVVEFVTGH